MIELIGLAIIFYYVNRPIVIALLLKLTTKTEFTLWQEIVVAYWRQENAYKYVAMNKLAIALTAQVGEHIDVKYLLPKAYRIIKGKTTKECIEYCLTDQFVYSEAIENIQPQQAND